MNRQQKLFLKSLLKSIEHATKAQDSIVTAVALGVTNKAGCAAYLRDLQRFIADANRMVMQCTVAFGQGSDRIAIDAMLDERNKN